MVEGWATSANPHVRTITKIQVAKNGVCSGTLNVEKDSTMQLAASAHLTVSTVRLISECLVRN